MSWKNELRVAFVEPWQLRVVEEVIAQLEADPLARPEIWGQEILCRLVNSAIKLRSVGKGFRISITEAPANSWCGPVKYAKTEADKPKLIIKVVPQG